MSILDVAILTTHSVANSNFKKQRSYYMTLKEIPIGTEVTVLHQYLVAETGYWSWEEEIVTGTVYKHCNESVTMLHSGTRLISCNNSKDEIIN